MENKVIVAVFLILFLAVSGFIINSGSNVDIMTSSENIFIPALVNDSYVAEEEHITTGKCNINTANEKELSELNGIGNTIAGRIVQYRESNGLFKSEEEIMNVKGIGEGIYTKIKEYITVEGE